MALVGNPTPVPPRRRSPPTTSAAPVEDVSPTRAASVAQGFGAVGPYGRALTRAASDSPNLNDAPDAGASSTRASLVAGGCRGTRCVPDLQLLHREPQRPKHTPPELMRASVERLQQSASVAGGCAGHVHFPKGGGSWEGDLGPLPCSTVEKPKKTKSKKPPTREESPQPDGSKTTSMPPKIIPPTKTNPPGGSFFA